MLYVRRQRFEPFMIQGQTDEETEADLNVWLYANAPDCIE